MLEHRAVHQASDRQTLDVRQERDLLPRVPDAYGVHQDLQGDVSRDVGLHPLLDHQDDLHLGAVWHKLAARAPEGLRVVGGWRLWCLPLVLNRLAADLFAARLCDAAAVEAALPECVARLQEQGDQRPEPVSWKELSLLLAPVADVGLLLLQARRVLQSCAPQEVSWSWQRIQRLAPQPWPVSLCRRWELHSADAGL